jgi:hypothetical protein
MVEYGKDNATVILNWTQQNGALYYANIIPQVPITFVTNTSIELIVPFNVQYNLSIIGSLCDQNGTATIIDLNFGEFNYL